MILQVRIDYWDSAWKNLTVEQWADLRASIPALPEEQPESYFPELMVDDDGLRALAKYGLQIRLDDSPASTNVNTMLVKLQDRINALELKSDDIPKLISEGAAVQICIPDMPLMFINEVTVLDRACTDQVQNMLDEGWRILAVCPPNAQRRPDYVMGRRRDADSV